MLATFPKTRANPALRSTTPMTTTKKPKPTAKKPTKSAKSTKSTAVKSAKTKTYSDAENERDWREMCAEMGEDPNERD
jgi:hypothetical protein